MSLYWCYCHWIVHLIFSNNKFSYSWWLCFHEMLHFLLFAASRRHSSSAVVDHILGQMWFQWTTTRTMNDDHKWWYILMLCSPTIIHSLVLSRFRSSVSGCDNTLSVGLLLCIVWWQVRVSDVHVISENEKQWIQIPENKFSEL